MSTDSVPALSEEAWALLHDLRLRGFRPAKGVAVEEQLVAAGLVMARGANIALLPAGPGGPRRLGPAGPRL